MILVMITLLLCLIIVIDTGKSPVINAISQDPVWGPVSLIGFILFNLWFVIRFFKNWDMRESMSEKKEPTEKEETHEQ